jgi:hypothetical protein
MLQKERKLMILVGIAKSRHGRPEKMHRLRPDVIQPPATFQSEQQRGGHLPPHKPPAEPVDDALLIVGRIDVFGIIPREGVPQPLFHRITKG